MHMNQAPHSDTSPNASEESALGKNKPTEPSAATKDEQEMFLEGKYYRNKEQDTKTFTF